MAERANEPQDDRVTSVPMPTDVGAGADRVIAQQNQNPEVAAGGGEWPSPHTPPSGPAPGGPPPRLASRTDAADDEEGEFPPMREVLDADPVAGGSQSLPSDDDDEEGEGTTAGDSDAAERWGGSRLP